jgi:ATP-dependent DNA helicase PIF1
VDNRYRDGKLDGHNDGIATVEIPDDLLIKTTEGPIAAIVESTYPSLPRNILDPSFLEGRGILAPTLNVVESVNKYVISLNHSEEATYLSSDSMSKADSGVDLLTDIHTPEFLNAIRCSGMPNHEIKLKVWHSCYAVAQH